MSFLMWLTILFVGLKLTGFIGWSIWIVLIPMYFQIGINVIQNYLKDK